MMRLPAEVQPPPPSLPLLRGRLHAVSAVLSVPAGLLLLLLAHRPAAAVAAALYSAALLLMFTFSAVYHHSGVSSPWRPRLQRLDHCGIYLLIAGTYVPLCLVALPLAWGIPLLSAVGAGALAGIVMKLTNYRRSRVVGYVLYLAMGWAAVAAGPALVHHLSAGQLALFVAGGLMYTIGFPVLVARWPNPWPRTFGYHEVWHSFTVAAAVLHFVAVFSLIS